MMSDDLIVGKIDKWYVQSKIDIYGTTPSEYVLWGYLQEDRKGRFPDDTYIHTSGISSEEFPAEDLQEGDTVCTRNSKYILGKKLRTPVFKECNIGGGHAP